jgi:hypothetical protein
VRVRIFFYAVGVPEVVRPAHVAGSCITLLRAGLQPSAPAYFRLRSVQVGAYAAGLHSAVPSRGLAGVSFRVWCLGRIADADGPAPVSTSAKRLDEADSAVIGTQAFLPCELLHPPIADAPGSLTWRRRVVPVPKPRLAGLDAACGRPFHVCHQRSKGRSRRSEQADGTPRRAFPTGLTA